MRHVTLLAAILLLSVSNQPASGQDAFMYRVDVQDQKSDLFHVTLTTPALSPADSVYSFTAFAPGVHQVLDFGRFVTSFSALDTHGNEIPTERRSTNDWAISDPTRVTEI
ncbi:MAG: hypothetical protein R3178_08175, partial [Rhodothermales bacterium]|nr:hypothetical protein [Rhodothermales bacterium]